MPGVDPALLRGNSLLATLPQAELVTVGRSCEQTELKLGSTICKAGETIRHVYFPTTSYVSLITPVGGAESVEVGMVGHEGVFGATVMLEVKTSPVQGLVQGGGGAIRMSIGRLNAAISAAPSLRTTLNRYIFVLTALLAQTVACNRYHLLDARLARWLLMTQDRAQSPTFRLTHKFLAYMLGVTRPGVTEAAGRLQTQGLIQYTRGEVTVINRAGLERKSCPCYSIFAKTYTEHLRPLRRIGMVAVGTRPSEPSAYRAKHRPR